MRPNAVLAGAARINRKGALASDPRIPDQRAPIVGLESVNGNIGDIRAYQHDHVAPGSALPVAEQLPDQPLRPVPTNGTADTPRGDYAEPGHVEPIRQGEQGQVAAPTSHAIPLHPQKLRPSPYPFAPGQSAAHALGRGGRDFTERRCAGAPSCAGA